MGALAGDSFTAVNKRILRYFQGDGTLSIVLCELVSIYKYMVNQNQVDELDSFPLPIAFLKKTMNLSEFKQKRSLDTLQDNGFIIVTRVGMPASRRVSLNFEAIALLLNTEVEKEREKEEKQRTFYENITKVSKENILNPSEFFKALDNIKMPLANCLLLVTERGRWLENFRWDPFSLSVVKRVQKYYDKGPSFDFGRFEDLLDRSDNIKDFNSLIQEINKNYKMIPERSPQERKYG